jgi:hypothetical protein
MDDAFWNYNRDLCELHKFLLFYMRIIGKERVQEHVCLGIHQLSRRLDQTELEKDYDHTTQQLFEEVYYNGQLSITKLYEQVGESLAPKLYTLCSKYSARTVQLACMKTQQQFEFQKHYLVLHLKEYAHRKLREVQESKSKKLNLETSFLNEVKTNDHLFKHQVTIPAGNVQVIERKHDLKEVDKVTENAFQNIKKHVQFLVNKGFLVASESCEFVDINYATPALFTKRLQILCCGLVSIASSTACICTQSCSDVKNQNHGQQKSSISTTEVHPSIRLCRLLSSFAGVLERGLIGSQLHEVQDQTSIELSKFLLTIFPHCFAVDLVLLKFYDGVIEDGHFFVSDELLVFIKQGWVGRDSLLRILSSIAREKTGAFYEHCRSLDGMSALLRQGIVFFYRRLVCTWKESNMQKIQTHWCESVNVDSLCSDVTTLLDEKHSEFLKSL